MREAFISILAILAFASPPPARCSELGRDGFNFYKDYLRARSDEALLEGSAAGERIYFYRRPLYPGLLQALEQEYKKRTGNAFKSHMLNKVMWAEADLPRKRSSKAALSLMMKGKHESIDSSLDDDIDLLVD